MANFSVNQVRHLYVVNEVGTVTEKSEAGAIEFKTTKDGKHVYFQYKGADNMMRTDLIDVDNILWTRAVEADHPSQQRALKQATVTLDKDVNEGKVIPGQDYILRIVINPYIGMSDEEPYFKYGVVHATRAMVENPGKFYTKLAASLYKNFSREIDPMLQFSIDGKVVGRVKYNSAGEEVLVDEEGADITVADSYADGVVVTELMQPWHRGIQSQTFVNFQVIPTTVTYDGEEVKWGTVEEADSDTVVGNARRIADLEHFCMGERGDQYRLKGWPNVIFTEYLVKDTAPTDGYNIFEIHYAYVGPNEGPQRSERDMTLVCKDSDMLQGLMDSFNKATNCETAYIPKSE